MSRWIVKPFDRVGNRFWWENMTQDSYDPDLRKNVCIVDIYFGFRPIYVIE